MVVVFLVAFRDGFERINAEIGEVLETELIVDLAVQLLVVVDDIAEGRVTLSLFLVVTFHFLVQTEHQEEQGRHHLVEPELDVEKET
jgi:hypothetical protein